MSACIFLFGLFFSIVQNFQYIVKSAESSVVVTVFFEPGTTEERIKEIGQAIEKRQEVSKIEFESAQAAWEEYKKVYFKGSEEMAAGFAQDNPLANSAEVFKKSFDIFSCTLAAASFILISSCFLFFWLL